MSVWNYLLDSEWSQRSDIEDLKRKNENLLREKSYNRNMVKDLEQRVQDLEEQIETLNLLNKAMLITLRKSDNWDDEGFLKATDDQIGYDEKTVKSELGVSEDCKDILNDPVVKEKAELLRKMYGKNVSQRYLNDIRKKLRLDLQQDQIEKN